MRLSSMQMQGARRCLERSGLPVTAHPDELFFAGRSALRALAWVTPLIGSRVDHVVLDAARAQMDEECGDVISAIEVHGFTGRSGRRCRACSPSLSVYQAVTVGGGGHSFGPLQLKPFEQPMNVVRASERSR